MHSKGTLDLDITTDNSRFASCGKWRRRERNTRVPVIVIPSVKFFESQFSQHYTGNDRTVYVWDVTSGNIIRKFWEHEKRVNAVK